MKYIWFQNVENCIKLQKLCNEVCSLNISFFTYESKNFLSFVRTVLKTNISIVPKHDTQNMIPDGNLNCLRIKYMEC